MLYGVSIGVALGAVAGFLIVSTILCFGSGPYRSIGGMALRQYGRPTRPQEGRCDLAALLVFDILLFMFIMTSCCDELDSTEIYTLSQFSEGAHAA
jgi:hypothetical protein